MRQSSVVAREQWSGSVAGIDILEVIVTGPFSIGLGSYLEVPRDFGRRLGTLVFEISISVEDWYIFGSPRLSINIDYRVLRRKGETVPADLQDTKQSGQEAQICIHCS